LLYSKEIDIIIFIEQGKGIQLNYLTFISAVILTISLIQGFYIIHLNSKSVPNRLFFMINICLVVWLTGASLGYVSQTKNEVLFWFRFSTFGYIFLHSFTLHFCILFSGQKKSNRFLEILIYTPSVILYIVSFFRLIVFSDFVFDHSIWIGIPNFNSILFRILVLQYVTYYILSFIILIRWGIRAQLKRDKRNAFTLAISMGITIVLFNLEPFILPFFTPYKTIMLSPNFGFIWITGIWISLNRYNFLAKNETIIKNILLDNMESYVVIFDAAINHIEMNKKASTLGMLDFKSFFFTQFTGDLIKMSRKISIPTNTGTRLLEYRVNTIRDSYNDIAGFVLIAEEIEALSGMQSKYKITVREFDVIKMIVSGCNNNEIAEKLFISLRTVKTHITNIYQKIGVNNKVQLLAILSQYEY